MTTSIKITALQNIGANIAYTTLVPVVNMSGTPTTQKANLQIVGNLILNGAGGSYFPRAAQANLALSVANAAQPNITSVGTLTSLAVTGNITAGNINGGNLVVANYFSGDGGFLSNVSGLGSTISNGTSNITIVNNGAISMGVNGSANVAQVGISGVAVTGGISASGNVNAGQNFRAPGELRVICNTGNGSGATWRFGTGGALYWPAPGGALWAIEPNIDNEFEIRSTSNVVISTDVSNSNSHFTFDSDGIFRAPSNVVLSGTTLFVGPNAESATYLTDATMIVGGNSNSFVQAVMFNENSAGSTDWIAQGANATNTDGYADFGFNSKNFSDANYSMTGGGDGYVFVQTYTSGAGGNLVLATGTNGTTKDIIFGTNGFTSSNIFGRISHANNALELTRANSKLVAPVVKTTPVTVSALPSAATAGAGARAFVTDANSTTFNAAAVGGGANNMPVFSNGTGWFIG